MQIHQVFNWVPKVKNDWNLQLGFLSLFQINKFLLITFCVLKPLKLEKRNGQHILPPTADAVDSHCLPILP